MKLPKAVFPAVLLVLAVVTAILVWVIFTLQQNLKIISASVPIPTPSILPIQPIITLTTTPVPTSTPTPTPFRPITYGNQLRLPILMYHYVGNNPNPKDLQRNVLSISPDKFEEQMKFLHDNGYNTTTLDTLYAALKKQTVLPPKSVILSFDDGYMDFFYNAYPVLLRYNLKATEFIPTGLIGGSYYLTWDQISQMHNSGLVFFGAHSIHHYNLTVLSSQALEYELKESKVKLEQVLGVPVNFMAYPYGITNDYVIQKVKAAGFLGSTGTWASITQSEGTIYDMPRFRISGSISFQQFQQYL